MEVEDNIQWHPAFCSAIELELRENRKDLTYVREHNLSKMPLKIDFLVIKKKKNAVIKNEIGDFFLEYNIFEYKSPGDGVNAGTLYKVLSYACLYKAEEEGVEEILDANVTITLVREQKPVKLLNQLKKKYTVVRKGEGIYRVSGMLFPIQILVTRELNKKDHIWVASLTRTMDRERAQELLDNCSELYNEEDRKNADSVINVASEANMELFKKLIQEGDHMCEELKELLAPEIVEFKIQLAEQNAQLAEQNAQLADNAAEIAKLKKMLAEAGVKV